MGSSSSCPGLWQMPEVRPSPMKGRKEQSPRLEGGGGRAALHSQHSRSILQRLVLAPLLLPYCFQKH